MPLPFPMHDRYSVDRVVGVLPVEGGMQVGDGGGK